MKLTSILYTAFASAIVLIAWACGDNFLEQKPNGVYEEELVLNRKGVEGMLINAYAALDGNIQGTGNIGASVGADNWIFGSVLGGEAYKAGVNFADQGQINAIMQYASTPTIVHIDAKWNSIFDGIARANKVLSTLPRIPDSDLKKEDKIRIEAEAKFIRAFQHFEGKKVFNNIPFVEETATDFKIPNTDAVGNYVNCWPQIEADFLFAFMNLPEKPSSKGRVNNWAAASFLAKAKLYQRKYREAKILFDDIIAHGKNSSGVPYGLQTNFGSNFRIATQNSNESIFEVQMTVADGSATNGFQDMVLNYPNGIAGGTNSWFFRPSQNIVNAYRTDNNGLPMPSSYNTTDVTSFENVPDDQPFMPYAGNLDPRLDHTVGRRGIPFHDWGMMTGIAFTGTPGESITNGGPYCQKKFVFSRSEYESGDVAKASWGYFASSMNYIAMRYADLLLMAAECEIESGSLDVAREYVNRIRARAAASPILNMDRSGDAASYHVGQYRNAWVSKDEAWTAVRFERRLELAQEGHAFFDLVRWGIAEQFVNNEYLPKEAGRRPLLFGKDMKFIVNRCEFQPIPVYAITQSNVNGTPTLKQNPGY